jgi:hypothetical protein
MMLSRSRSVRPVPAVTLLLQDASPTVMQTNSSERGKDMISLRTIDGG